MQREATGATTEKPFAGGLIGGESAFAGQAVFGLLFFVLIGFSGLLFEWF